MTSAPYKPWLGPPLHERDHACTVDGCPEKHAPFGVERLVRDGQGRRQHGVDLKYFCRRHLGDRDAYDAALNGAPERGLPPTRGTQEKLL
ncbi:MAG: hypothetical protein AAFX92_03870 [Pseudomonadota bacterium]